MESIKDGGYTIKMGSKWQEIAEARQRVAELLEQAGIPLELKVGKICDSFCPKERIDNEPVISTTKLIYSPTNEPDSYREIDQLVNIYEEFDTAAHTGIILNAHVPIECKHRHNTEYFAFPIEPNPGFEGFPVCSTLAGSQYFRRLFESLGKLSDFSSMLISTLEIRDGTTPIGIHKENLLYSSAAALYDFILTDIEKSQLASHSDESLKQVGSFSRFQKYVEENNYAWWQVLREEIAKLTPEECQSYNKLNFPGGRIYESIYIHVPVVCVDGPIYRVAWNSESKISDFTPIKFCAISIRKHNWPGTARFALLRRTPEVPAVLTNPEGLTSCLEAVLSWYKEIKKLLLTAPSEILDRWPLEAAFYAEAISYYSEVSKHDFVGYRSDLDVHHFI